MERERAPFTLTCCDLLVKKSRIHPAKNMSKLNKFISLSTSRCGWMVLKADEKSINNSLACVLSASRCFKIKCKSVFNASSTPLLGLYANCSGSKSGSTFRKISSLTSLSKTFITSDVRATGRKSLKFPECFVFGTGTIIECFQSSGTFWQDRDMLKM